MSTIGNTFRTGEPGLTELLNQVHSVDAQLLDLQRGRVWDDSHIRPLIAGVSKSFPIGSVRLLETGGEGVRFEPHVVEGAPENDTNPEQRILDDLQRIPGLPTRRARASGRRFMSGRNYLIRAGTRLADSLLPSARRGELAWR